MSASQSDRARGAGKADPARTERLAAALRRNLFRRKDRERALAAREATDAPEARPEVPAADGPASEAREKPA